MEGGSAGADAPEGKKIPMSFRGRRKAGIKEKELPVAALPKVSQLRVEFGTR
jgi:hypothetical protein